MKQLIKNLIVYILTLEARRILSRHKPYIVMVTGSVGKTSTKDAVYTALKSIFPSIRKSEKSQNSDIGVPLTVLGLDNAWMNPLLWFKNIIVGFFRAEFSLRYPEYLVLEVGADKPYDIVNILEWIKPDMVVETRFPDLPVHVQFYKSPEEVIKEEISPAFHIKRDGVLVINNDDRISVLSGEGYEGEVITYGLTPDAHVYAEGEEVIYREEEGQKKPIGMKFDVHYKNEIVPFRLYGVLGGTHIYTTLAGVASALSKGAKLLDLARVFDDHNFPRGRMAIVEGMKGTTIIDDTYNSSPIAVEWALASLNSLSVNGRKIVALGDMRELGSFADEEHYKVGINIAENVKPYLLILVGPLSRKVAEGALAGGYPEDKILQYDNSREAGKYLEGILQDGDVVLAKGSQNTIRMEWLVEEIMAHPEDREKLLVRQEEFWR